MSKAPRLMPADDLERVRQHVLAHGGIVFRRMCPRTTCHSVVVRHHRAVVCLTCGWSKPVARWGVDHRYLTPQQVAHGKRAEFRGLSLHADPQRWARLVRRAHKRGNLQQAWELEKVASVPSEAQRLTLSTARRASHKPTPYAADGRPLERCAPRRLASAAEVLIYTDGGCSPNPGPGGWAAILWGDGSELEIAGREPHSSNSRMELKAALEGLRALREPSRVTIVTDSVYLSSGMTAWITGWSKRDWRRDGRRIPNSDLWRSLAEVALEHETYWCWTKGHAGHTEHERCDLLAARMTWLEDEQAEQATHCRQRQRKGKLPRLKSKATAPVWLPGQGG